MPMEKGRKLPYADHSRKVWREGNTVFVHDKKGERTYECSNESNAQIMVRMMKCTRGHHYM